MKILIITPYFEPAWAYGGPPKILSDLSKFLTKNGYQVTVYTTDVLDRDSRQSEFFRDINGIKVLSFKNISNSIAYKYKIFAPLGLRKAIKSNIDSFDIVLLSDARTYLNKIALRYILRNRIPYIHLAYGSLPIVGSLLKRLLKRIYDFNVMKKLLFNASALIAQTNHEVDEYLKFGAIKDNIKLIPLATDINLSECSLQQKKQTCQKWGIKQEDILIVSVGRINKLKIFDIMLDVILELVNKNNRFKWVLIGRDDGYLDYIHTFINKNNLSKNFIFTGPQYGDEKIQVLRRANCFFLAPSHFEETSTASLEALAVGTPCVVSEQCEIPFLEEYGAGKVVKYDMELLVQAIIDVTSISKLSYDYNCQRLIKDKFSWEAVGSMFDKLLLDINIAVRQH